MRWKTMLLLVIMGMTLLPIFASGEGEGPASTSPGGAEPVEITLLIDNQSPLDGLKAVAAAAEEKLGIKVTFEFRPGGPEGENYLKTRLVAGDMSDLSYFNSGSLFLALNPPQYFVDLTDEAFMDPVIATFKQVVSVNGRVYAAPAGEITAGGWFYNKKVYERLGLEVPHTWHELMANCEKIKAAGIPPIAASYKDSWTSQLILLADYYNVQRAYPDFHEDYTAHRAGFADTPAARRGFEKLREVYERGFLSPHPASTTYENALLMLANGEAAHYPMATVALANLQAVAPDKVSDIGFFGQPGDDPSDHGVTIWLPAGLSIWKGSHHIDEAKRFLAFFLSQEGLDTYMRAQKPFGPFPIQGISLPDDIFPATRDLLSYIDAGKTAPALEFISPIKGPNLPQICVEVGLGLKSPVDGAREYDRDVEKQAKQLGLPGW
ncbi:ABC transporter substrate-binding protein [Spirochaeta thermophila]|nr:ABC transporter substrate-binding protein [Spirochaeta thermophila]